MSDHHLLRHVNEVERLLGHPGESGSPLSMSSVLEADLRGVPGRGWSILKDAGLHRLAIPHAEGGQMPSLDRLGLAMRAIARRDPMVSLAFSVPLVAALPVWLVGKPTQRADMAQRLTQGHAVARTFGAAASDVAASDSADHLLLAQGDATHAVIQLNAAGAAPSVCYLGPDVLAGLHATSRERLRCHGNFEAVRLQLEHTGIPTAHRVGDEGQVRPLISATQGVSRVLHAMASCGVLDTAWHLCHDFLSLRVLYGRPALTLPLVERDMAVATSRMVAAECVALMSTRMASTYPGHLAWMSASASIFVSSQLAKAMNGLSVLLGARHYVREGRHCLFQKLTRDLPWFTLLDQPAADLTTDIAQHLRAMSAQDGKPSLGPADSARINQTFDLAYPLKVGVEHLMTPQAHACDPFSEALARLACALERRDLGPGGRAMLGLCNRILKEKTRLATKVRGELAHLPDHHPDWSSACARHVSLFGATCLLLAWYHNLDMVTAPSQGRHLLGLGDVGIYGAVIEQAIQQSLADVETVAIDAAVPHWMRLCADRSMNVGLLTWQHARALNPENHGWIAA